jgi:hypothetical protein
LKQKRKQEKKLLKRSSGKEDIEAAEVENEVTKTEED